MQTLVLVATLLILSAVGFYLGRSRALVASSGIPGRLHSLPVYYGFYVAIWCGIPAIAVMVLWLVFEPAIVETLVVSTLPEAAQALPDNRLNLLLNDIRNLASGNIVSREVDPELQAAADHYASLNGISDYAKWLVVLCLAIAGLGVGRRYIEPNLRARNKVERVVMVFLVVSSTVAILTTLGIMVSLIGETILFFDRIDWKIGNFLFGTNWNPLANQRAVPAFIDEHDVGWLPLLAGTLMITVIAMLVAVPIGLMTAVYLSDFASPMVRAVVKPVLEILAGIPTVVYGFFA
ncbi:MAG: phosphate ABC transporter permease family protein, partial [Rhodospirillales bacterium]|nr:phosphate ABC transporter permease family protein [Rhodospirillales bacterium]